MTGYSVSHFGRMLADEIRMRPYLEALKRAVAPGAVVLDIGAGTGIFSLVAARLGARKVFAVEKHDVIEIAKMSARANGFADRIECIRDSSTNIELPERADVIVSDLRGVLPLVGGHIDAIIDARKRHLADTGQLISRSDTLRIAAVSAPAIYSTAIDCFRDHARGFVLECERRYAVNDWYVPEKPSADYLTAPTTWVTLDYATIGTPDVAGTVELTIEREGTAHGLALWFDATVAPGLGFSTAPCGLTTVYRNGFFPFLEAIAVTRGDVVAVEIEAKQMGDHYQWRWNTRVTDGNDTEKAYFRQATFLGTPISPSSLRKNAL